MPSALRLRLPVLFSTLAAVLLGAAALLPAVARAQGGTGGTSFTTTTTNSTLVVFSGDGMQHFHTRLEAPREFDLSFDQAIGDPVVQAAITAARKILLSAGVPQSVANQGPVRVASALTTSGAGGVTGSQTTTTVLPATVTIGPATIFIGDNKATPFFVAAGDTNIDIETRNITTITQNRGGSLLSETYVLPIDFGAVLSLAESGLPVALVQREALLAVEQVATRDINGRLFRLRAESSQDTASAGGVAALGTAGGGRGVAGPVGKESKAYELRLPGWEVFASGDFGLADQEQDRAHAGFGSATLAGTAGVERRLAPGLTLGLAGTWLENRTELSNGLGRLNIDGFALAAYASYVRAPFYADLLYSFGDYEDEVHRNTLFGVTARATPHARHHTVQFHTGWNFHAGPVVTGPLAAVSYTHGALDGYTETGAGAQDTRVAAQGYDSLRTELGWQASQRVPVSFGAVTWQLRASWQRENLDGRESVSVGLVNSPLFAVGGNGSLHRTGSLALNGQTARPGDDYLALGGGLHFAIGERTQILLDYEEDLARARRSEHLASVRLSVSF